MALLPNPAQATSTSVIKSGKTYTLVPAMGGKQSYWVVSIPGAKGLHAVDIDGNLTGTLSKPVFADQTALKAAVTAASAPKTTAAPSIATGFTLPDPNKATAASYTSNGIQFVSVPGKYSDVSAPANAGKAPTQAAGKWVALIPGQESKGYFNVNVDSSGKPTIQTTVGYATSSALNTAKQQYQQSADAAKAWVDPTLAAAKAAGFQDVASWQAATKAAQAAGFGTDIAKHQIYLKAEEAKRQAEAQRQAQLKAEADAKARAEAEAAAAKAAEAKRLEQEQIAKAQAEYEAAEAQRQQQQQQQVAAGKKVALQQTLESQLPTIKSQAELDVVEKQAQDAGITLNQGQLERARLIATQNEQRMATERQAAFNQQYLPKLSEARTQQDFDRVVAEAKAAGGTLDATQVKSYQDRLTQSLGIQEQQRIQTAQNQYRDQLAFVNTQEGLDKIKADAAKANVPLTDDMLAKANQAIVNRNQFFDQVATAVKDLPLPQRGQDITTIGGMNIMGIPDDPVTGAKGGFYVNTGSGFQKLDSSGRPTGSVVPFDQYDQMLKTTNTNVTQYQAEQSAATKAREMSEAVAKFEAALPQPGSEQWNNLLANRFSLNGPDGRIYELVDKSLATGAPAKWIVSTSSDPQTAIGDSETYTELGKPDQVFTKGDVNQIFTQNAEIRDAQAKAERAAAIASQRAEANDYGPFDDILYATLAVVAIGAIAGAASSYLGSLATSAEATALAGEAATTAGTMAQGGASAAEIAGVMESTYGMSSSAASQLASTASGAVNGVVSAGELASTLASSGVTPEMMAIANSAGVTDGIAALNALTGWTGSDMAYLASIGMPEAVMGAAAVANAGFGLPTTVEGWAAATEVASGAGAGAGAGSGPVAPGAAVDTSQMIPAYDAAGNVGYMDPATGNFYTESGQLISEGSSGFTGPGTEYANVNTGTVTDVGVGSGQGPGETFTQIFDDGSQLITDAAGNPVGGIDSAGNAFSVNPETGAGFYPETGLPTAGAGGGGGVPGAVTGGEAPVVPTESAGISNITDAQFVAEDAAQLAKQGLSQSQIESTLLFSGVDPLVAADAAALASSGLGAGAIAPALEQSGAALAGGAPEIFTSIPGGIAEPLPGYAGPQGSAPIYGTNTPPPVYDKSVPFDPNAPQPTLTEGLKSLGGAVKEALPSLGVSDALAVIGAANVLGPIIAPPPKLEEYQYGPLAPIQYGQVGTVNAPGLNPGLIGQAPRDYQTTSPVQSKFYYGPRPYQAGTQFDPASYAAVPKPAQPYGLQQAFFETPQSYDQYQFRPYAPDLTLTDPLTTTYQPVVPQPLR